MTKLIDTVRSVNARLRAEAVSRHNTRVAAGCFDTSEADAKQTKLGIEIIAGIPAIVKAAAEKHNSEVIVASGITKEEIDFTYRNSDSPERALPKGIVAKMVCTYCKEQGLLVKIKADKPESHSYTGYVPRSRNGFYNIVASWLV